MAKIKVAYTKQAKTLNEQIAILKSRNVVINDEDKAKEYLSDIGYYRLGFYSFPFENTYPHLGRQRKHDMRPGTSIEDIVALYYYDFDLRTILNRYLSRIEVSIRTTLVYRLSCKYPSDPFWFVNPAIVTPDFVKDFNKEVYCHLRNKPTIKRHHAKYVGKWAPAWKTIEFMTMGNLETLYENLLFDKDKKLISTAYGEPATATFKSYMSAIRSVRNACAHGNVIYGLKLENGIIAGRACGRLTPGDNQSLTGALKVIDYMLRSISVNRANEMWKDLYAATSRLYGKVPFIKPLIEKCTGIVIPTK